MFVTQFHFASYNTQSIPCVYRLLFDFEFKLEPEQHQGLAGYRLWVDRPGNKDNRQFWNPSLTNLSLHREKITHLIENNPNHQTTARTHGDFLPVSKIVDCNLEAVATWTWVVVDLDVGVEGHVFDFDFVVNGEGFVGHFVVFHFFPFLSISCLFLVG